MSFPSGFGISSPYSPPPQAIDNGRARQTDESAMPLDR